MNSFRSVLAGTGSEIASICLMVLTVLGKVTGAPQAGIHLAEKRDSVGSHHSGVRMFFAILHSSKPLPLESLDIRCFLWTAVFKVLWPKRRRPCALRMFSTHTSPPLLLVTPVVTSKPDQVSTLGKVTPQLMVELEQLVPPYVRS